MCRNIQGLHMSDSEFDWAQSALRLFQCDSLKIEDLVLAANLDPINGDLRGADFSNLDLSNCNLSGWDLRDATFIGADLSNTKFHGSKVDLFSLLDANNWEKALYTKGERATVERLFDMRRPIASLDKLEAWIEKRLREADIEMLGDLVQMRPKELLRISGFGRYSLHQVRYSLAMRGLDIGVRVKGWPAARMRKIFSNHYYPAIYVTDLIADDPRLAVDF